MAVQNGLNVRLYVMGFDLSGSANAIDSMGYSQALLDTTPLNKEAQTRMVGLNDGTLSVNSYFDTGATGNHALYSSNSGKLPTADQVVLVPMGSAVGDPAIGISGKQAEYNVSRSDGSVITQSIGYSGNGMGGEFGVMLTAHDDTHSSATNGTSVDNGASSANGAVGYIQIFALASGTVVAKIQHSADNSTFADLISFTSTAAASAPTAYRATATGTINRYTRVITSGTFSNAQIASQIVRL